MACLKWMAYFNVIYIIITQFYSKIMHVAIKCDVLLLKPLD